MDADIMKSVDSIINTLAVPARILGGVLIVISISIMAIQIIMSKKTEQRVQLMEGLPMIALASFILGSMSLILGFFNSFSR